MQKLQVHLIRNRLVVPREERVARYREIAELIGKGDAAGAENCARQYARRTAQLTLPLFSESGSQRPGHEP
jgi:DNA-binding FadR family transcriptional regulator